MSLMNFYPHRCGRNYWDVWDWPQTLLNQNFGLDMDDIDWMTPSLRVPSQLGRTQKLLQKKGVSEVVNDANKFEIKLDCSHFKPEDIEVKTVDNSILIHGKHEEKMDKHGWVSREFTRRYALPEGCDSNEVISALNSNGILTIEAPKKQLEPLKDNERMIPIKMVESNANQIQN